MGLLRLLAHWPINAVGDGQKDRQGIQGTQGQGSPWQPLGLPASLHISSKVDDFRVCRFVIVLLLILVK